MFYYGIHFLIKKAAIQLLSLSKFMKLNMSSTNLNSLFFVPFS